MNQDHKQRLTDRLMRGIPKESPVYRELEKMYIEDLDSIEPELDAIFDEERRALLEHIFKTVLSPEQVVEVYARLLREGRVQPQREKLPVV